ncbi:sulfotransferase 2B1-like [Xiphias gladius]|uniref:sulfotransferase 2B1-like n=1 Tax=Xiphias gladius TaxID=8245 RepID=UPI001A98AFFF|nr:sulfotransferase 2B1-like [Xiphias gladius]
MLYLRFTVSAYQTTCNVQPRPRLLLIHRLLCSALPSDPLPALFLFPALLPAPLHQPRSSAISTSKTPPAKPSRPSTIQVIYVMRNPKDVFTSSFHYYAMTSFLVNPGPQNEFFHKFLDGKVMFGSWFDHVKGWLSAADKERVMPISYEELIMDLKDSVARIAQFVEKPLDTEVIEKIADRCLFKNMKQNNMSNYSAVPHEYMDQTKSEFLRKGIAGDWKNQLTVAEVEYFDAVYDVKYKFVWDRHKLDERA